MLHGALLVALAGAKTRPRRTGAFLARYFIAAFRMDVTLTVTSWLRSSLAV